MKEIRGKEGKKKEKWKKEGAFWKKKIKVSQHDERDAMQFQAQADKPGLKGRKLQGHQGWQRKEPKNNEHFQTYFFGIYFKKCRVPLLNNYDFALYFFSFFLSCNYIKDTLFFLRFACNPPMTPQLVPPCRKKLVIIVLTNGKRSKSGAPITPPREAFG